MELKARWKDVMRAFNMGPNWKEYEYVESKYNEPHRAYHNLSHIQDCLVHLDAYPSHLEQRNEIELAIFYHDVIYDPYRKNNEQKSADEASRFLSNQTASHADVSIIQRLILATLHNQPPKSISEAVIMDIDIAILGSTPENYLEYSKNIRKEYKWVPSLLYKRKRKEVLKCFLNRERLYSTDHFFKQFEKSARENLNNEINTLN